MEDFGTSLADRRKAAGLSQQQVADRLHVTRQAVSRWEQNRTQPDLATLRQLAGLLDCTADELLRGLPGPDESLARKTAVQGGAARGLFRGGLAAAGLLCALFIWRGQWTGILYPIVLLLCYGTTYFAFNAMVKSGDYTMLAGYDPDCSYDYGRLALMLTVMNLWLVSLGDGFLLLGFLLLLPGPSWMMVLFILCYTFSFVATILLVQWKYGRQVLKDGPVQRSEWRPGLIWGVLFCLQLGMCLFCAARYHIPNNTPRAFVQLGWSMPGMLLGCGFLLWEAARAGRADKAGLRWHMHPASWALLALCLFLLAGQWHAAAQ